MRNDVLRTTTQPIWSEPVDTGGMFEGRLAVFEDTTPDRSTDLRFLAVASGGFGGGKQGRRATKTDAIRAAYDFATELWG